MHVDQTVGQQLVNVFPGRLLAALDERRELLQRLPRRGERLPELEAVDAEDQSRHARGEVLLGVDSLEQRSVDEHSELVPVAAYLGD